MAVTPKLARGANAFEREAARDKSPAEAAGPLM
jgi:hypothetical protein